MMPPAERTNLPHEKAAALAALFDGCAIPYAFGGAIALLYWSEPRGTVDIDLNIFLPVTDVSRVFSALHTAGIPTSARLEREVAEREQVRLDWDGTPVDLFFSYDPFHDSCQARAVAVDFFGQPARVLSAEDIVLFKALYNRPKDWLDIEQLITAQGSALDSDYVRDWIGRMLPASDGARQRLESLLRSLDTDRSIPRG